MITSIYGKNYADMIFDIIITLIVIVFSIGLVYPFLYVLSVSLSHPDFIAEIKFFPKGITFDSYRYIFSLDNVQSGYRNSVMYTVSGVAVNMILTILCAYPLSKKWLVGRKGITIYILITMYFSGGLIPLYLLVESLGMLNTIWSIIIPVGLNTWNMIVMRTFFQFSIPVEIEESCYIDGANELKILFKIYLPLSKPILATIGLFYFVFQWNSWFPASIYLNDSEKYPIQLVLRNVMATVGSSYLGMTDSAELGKLTKGAAINVQSLNNALTIAVVLPIIFIYPFCQRYFIKGVMIGSLKG